MGEDLESAEGSSGVESSAPKSPEQLAVIAESEELVRHQLQQTLLYPLFPLISPHHLSHTSSNLLGSAFDWRHACMLRVGMLCAV